MEPIDFFEAVDSLHEMTPPEEVPTRASRRPTLIGDLAPYWERYTDAAYQQAMRPLRVTVEVDGLMAGYDEPTIDGLLAAMVVQEALRGTPMDATFAPYILPVPLYRLWTCPDTRLPLWACNHFRPVGPNTKVTTFLHKRSIRVEHARRQKGQSQPYTIKGRHKEKRVPLPAQTARYWYADCIGHADEVARLMGLVEVMGKRRMALVRAVAVEPIERFGMNRPVPLGFFDEETAITRRQFKGWTPPYWPGVPECHAECGLPEL